MLLARLQRLLVDELKELFCRAAIVLVPPVTFFLLCGIA
jgi:hypothetical protein